ncbi:FAD-dependent monooxygenase [Neptunicoccus sediminis]|uniref:FAD-dependent monooxygenase n=1 Tax=Neptunicoccus sediminis TaxID=1892596 RepID=UPI00084618FB|nr:FAD-dependent monooxygenase [Neptunicoccus sediminis]
MIRSANIAGAGIGGLTAALALAQQGVEVCVFEQAAALGEVGAGLQLSPNAMKVLGQLGLNAQIDAVAYAPELARIKHGVTGRDLVRVPLRAQCDRVYGAPYLHVHRADLHRILEEAARRQGVRIETGATVTGYRAGALLVDGSERHADLRIGADGIRSAITAQMHPHHGPRFTGQLAWRGTVPTANLPKGLIPPDATVWVGQGGHIVTYYVRGGQLVNFVAVEERDDWQNPDWRQQGAPADLLTRFAGWHPDLKTLFGAVQSTYLWALFDRPELPCWSDGSTVLLGDACHPTLPFMAQGAAMAIEDASVLVRCLKHRAQDVPAALGHYTRLRKPRTTHLQARARKNAALFHLSGPFGGAVPKLKLFIAGHFPDRLGLRPFDEVYGYDATTAPL